MPPLVPRKSCCRPQLQPQHGSQLHAHTSITVTAAARSGGGPEGSSSVRPPHRNNREEHAPRQQGSALAKSINRKITDSESITELSDVWNEWGSSFNPIHTAAAFIKAAKLPDKRLAAVRQLLDRLAVLWEEQLPGADVQGMSSVLWACSKLHFASSSLWSSTVAAFMQQHKSDTVPQHHANVLYAYASIALANKGAVPGLTQQEVVDVFEQLTGQVYVMATAPVPDIAFQSLSNILWAHAKLGIQPAAADLCGLLKAAVRPQLLGKAASQSVANTLWAVSELRRLPGWEAQVQQQVWQQLLAEPQLRKLSIGAPIALANTLHSLSRLATPAPGDATPAISLEFAQQCAEQLLQGRAVTQLSSWNAQDVSNIMFACARLGVRDEQLLQRLAAAAPGWLQEAAAPAVNQVALACGQLGFRDTQLLSELLRRVMKLFKLSEQGRLKLALRDQVSLPISVAWALAVLDLPELVGSIQRLLAVSRIKHVSNILKYESYAARLRFVHTWLLGRQGLAGLAVL